LDDEFAAIASAESTFAGMYLDSTHTPVVLLTDVGRLARARSAGVEASLAKRRIPSGNVRVRSAAYGFATLKQWLDAAIPALNIRSLVFSGIDEMHNRLHIGVETARAQRDAQTQLVNLGIPAQAVAVDVVPRVQSLVGSMLTGQTLSDSVRPLRGGLFIITPQKDSGSCTLGFLANTNGSSPDSLFFFTASHCSETEMGLDSSPWYQGGPGSIGFEIRDPSLGRWSDASRNLVDVDSAGPVTVGLIAHTNGHSTTLVDPPLYATNYADPPMRGQIVYKVGFKTGTTWSTVTDPCANVYNDHGFYLRCQVRTWAWQSDTLAHGDSGSPIIQDVDDSTVALAGILWGGEGSHHDKWWFSPLNGIKTDLGDFNAVAWLQPTVTVSGPSNVEPGTYTWTAYPAGGNGSYTYQWQYQNAGSSTWTSLGTGQSQNRDIYASTPSFTIRVTVTSGGYTRTSIVGVTVYPPLTDVSLSGTSWARPGITCSWIASPTGGASPYTYEWPGSVVHTTDSPDTWSWYTSEGSFLVSVTVTSATGSQASTSQEVIV
jgi:hypothetical protein